MTVKVSALFNQISRGDSLQKKDDPTGTSYHVLFNDGQKIVASEIVSINKIPEAEMPSYEPGTAFGSLMVMAIDRRDNSAIAIRTVIVYPDQIDQYNHMLSI